MTEPFLLWEAAAEEWRDFDPRLLPWEDARAKRPLPEGITRAKRSPFRVVLRVERPAGAIYVKQARPANWHRAFSEFFEGSKLLREWNLLRGFAARGARVPEALFLGKSPEGFWYLGTRALPNGWRCVEDILRTGARQVDTMREAGRFAAWLHDAGLYHADFKGEHILETDAPADAPIGERFALVDLDGSQVRDSVGLHKRRRALRRLAASLIPEGLEQEGLDAFLAAYNPDGRWRINGARLMARARLHAASKRRLRRVNPPGPPPAPPSPR